jgi:uncharacterized membrane protein HdeD (DUF308 family)
LTVLFGLTAFVWPELSLRLLGYFFGAYALGDGVVSVVHLLTGQLKHNDWWLPLLSGLASIAVGVAVFVWPLLTGVLLLIFIAVRAVILGAVDIISAIRWRGEAVGLGLLILGGVVSLAFGLYILIRPGAGALALLWLVALYAVVVGVAQILLALVVRRRGRDAGPAGTAA